MDRPETFGQWVKQHRKALDLTQHELARSVGCSLVTILKIEADQRRPSRQLAELILRALQAPPDELPALLLLARGQGTSAQPGHESAAGDTDTETPAPPNNLPAQLTRFFGRERALADLCHLLSDESVRLLTLTGPPGVGKTRLAQQLAGRLLRNFEHGVYFVALAPLRDPNLVPAPILQTLGVAENAGLPPPDRLVRYLQSKRVLLVLDNFEQLLSAGTLPVQLLQECPLLKVVVTSREPLAVRGEHQFAVPPLQVPGLESLVSGRGQHNIGLETGDLGLETIERSESVRLFEDRAKTVSPDFQLTPENAQQVVTICARLDGLPLAIELVAARSKLLSPAALLSRLTTERGSTSLRLPAGGPQDLPPRHRTLRAAIDWSLDLLDREERAFFARLGVFVGGCSLAAIEAVCGTHGDAGTDVIDLAESLLNKSLIQLDPRKQEEDGPRFTLLETIRERALELLAQSGQYDEVHDLHLTYYLELAETADVSLSGPEQLPWLNRLERDHDNFRAALAWSFEHADPEVAARLAAALCKFWLARGHYAEARSWIERLLEKREAIPAPILGRLFNNAAIMASVQGDYARASELHNLGLELFRQLEDREGMANVLNNLGILARHRGELGEAMSYFEQSLALWRELRNELRIAHLIGNLGVIALEMGDPDKAEPLLEESLALCRALGNKGGMIVALGKLAELAQLRGDFDRMRALYTECIALCDAPTERLAITKILEGFAALELAQDDPRRAATLLGAVEGLVASKGATMPPADREVFTRYLSDARTRLSKSDFTEAWDKGYAMSLDQALAYANPTDDGRQMTNDE